MVFRDGFANCPRCALALEDARSAEGCAGCGGLWVAEPVLSEMMLEMLPHGQIDQLALAPTTRSETPLACPSCHAVMDQVALDGVPLDRCPKQHGVWFDNGELGQALLRFAAPDRPAPTAPDLTPRLAFAINGQSLPFSYHQQIIKIGRHDSAHVRLEEPQAARMHAVIEATSLDAVYLIDLGSQHGTYVNGARVSKVALRTGDQIHIGSTLITLTITRA